MNRICIRRRPAAREARGIRCRFPKTSSGWLYLSLAACFIMLLLTVAAVIGSVWIENRFPCEDRKRALLPAAQRIVSQPIVNALGRQIEGFVRRRAEAVYMHTGMSLEQTIARFVDERVAFAERRMYAYRLARVGSPECIAALRHVLGHAPPEQKAFIAQLIGSAGNPAVKPLLLPLLQDASETVVIGAIRGLSATGGEDVAAEIGAMLSDSTRLQTVRIEAATGLGNLATPAAKEALTQALRQTDASELATEILKGLGRFQFASVANTFERYLINPDTPAEMRVVAAEALAQSTTEAAPFLLAVAENDARADVRAAAAWAISAHQAPAEVGRALAQLVESEQVPDVRRRLYEALLPQSEVPAERLLPAVQAEQDVAARVAGFNVIGSLAGKQPTSSTASAFDREIVPELLQIATTPNTLNIQMRAVFALRRAQTERARAALAVIASDAHPQIAAAARNGLHSANNR
jgi:HEAT repeat protein